MSRALEILYNVLGLPVSVFAGGGLALSSRGRACLSQRFGSWGSLCGEFVWFHGASAGEINGLLPVITRYKAQNPAHKILVTATSVTGIERAKEVADETRLLPLDNGIWIKRAAEGVKISAFIFAETEIWPALIAYLWRRRVPIYMVNARISDYTFMRYRLLRRMMEPVLRRVRVILAANEVSARRFVELGAASESVRVMGNAKYDLPPSVCSPEEAQVLRSSFFANRNPVITLGSLRPGEEEVWFPALRDFLSPYSAINVIVAPRHKEKFEFFAAKLVSYGIKFLRWSELQSGALGPAQAGARVVLLDTFGDLERVYSFSEVVFIGATLVDIGGHNPLEAAAYGPALVVGPYVRNIEEIVSALAARDAVIAIRTVEDARRVLNELHEDRALVRKRGQAALEVWKLNSGASDRIVEQLLCA